HESAQAANCFGVVPAVGKSRLGHLHVCYFTAAARGADLLLASNHPAWPLRRRFGTGTTWRNVARHPDAMGWDLVSADCTTRLQPAHAGGCGRLFSCLSPRSPSRWLHRARLSSGKPFGLQRV